MTHTPTVTVHFSQAIVQAARRLGLRLPEEWATPADRERVDLAHQDRLWEHFCQAAGDPLVGLDLGLALQVGHLDTAGMILMSCETVGEALESLLDYHPIVGEGGDFQVAEEQGQVAVRYHPRYATRRPERVEAVLASLLNLSRWSTGEAFRARGLTLCHEPLDQPGRYQDKLGVPVVFRAPDNALLFDADQLGLPLVHANPALCRHLRGLADELLERLDHRSLGARVSTLIRENPGWGKERIADQLGISGRHLIRKLAEEGTSFKLLRDTLLRERAEQALRQGRRVADLAGELGFSDESAFTKAFKRWTGETPARFRREEPS
ncbi:AraC family transcriptional regulator [Alloalcanivorax gelatiniphagus]|uniref:AraC family transcriptional regulator n=1 Tax=Alloalcanivorax gelatiniphagus TaxID=1194167 RepID=A0ABY2XJP7_9GAMM|nr:AraC family transcriptional regulator [Alloalcanivorax gelatiniphagus]TMW11344.1 AraC family transcriptional regulator [Alloalcanivorax gelatiniphagus]|tara:strand:+ start:17329 stop:18297 length:969 start_codon:yes stop_codon:yes gene_type:complete